MKEIRTAVKYRGTHSAPFTDVFSFVVIIAPIAHETSAAPISDEPFCWLDGSTLEKPRNTNEKVF